MISLVLTTLLAAADPTGLAPPSGPEAAPAPVTKPRDTRLMDLEANTLDAGTWQFNLFGAVYSRGFGSRVTVSTSLLGDVATVVNLTVRAKLVDERALQATVEVGGAYFLAGLAVKTRLFWVPAELRATVPLTEHLLVTAGLQYRLVDFAFQSSAAQVHSLGWTANLAYHDPFGATFVQVTVPALSAARATVTQEGLAFAGTLVADGVPAWSVMVGRDQCLGRTGHLRVGVGYRNKPGIVVLESYGQVMAMLDFYWR